MSSWKKFCFIGKTNVIIRAGNEFTCHVLQYIIVYLGDMKNQPLVRTCVAKGFAIKNVTYHMQESASTTVSFDTLTPDTQASGSFLGVWQARHRQRPQSMQMMLSRVSSLLSTLGPILKKEANDHWCQTFKPIRAWLL